jgi:hypothetical protein
MVPERLKSTDAVLGLQEIRDMQQAQRVGGGGRRSSVVKPGGLLSNIAASLMGGEKPPAVVDVSKLKPTGYYTRAAETTWQFLKKAEEDTINFEGACPAVCAM